MKEHGHITLVLSHVYGHCFESFQANYTFAAIAELKQLAIDSIELYPNFTHYFEDSPQMDGARVCIYVYGHKFANQNNDTGTLSSAQSAYY